VHGVSPRPEPHPAQRFRAPTAIRRGEPLADLFDATAVRLIGASFAAVVPGFAAARFARACALDGLTLMQRAARIADALAAELPAAPAAALATVVAALGPPLTATSGNGLAPFFYLPHSTLVGRLGVAAPAAGLTACHALTRRFTAEFAIRPLLIAHPALALRTLHAWTGDPDPHVRRLVSEGTRPRLPWGIRLPGFQRDPTPVVPLLAALRDDGEPYVRRSVANHLGDILKDQPAIALALCRQWLDEVADDHGARGRQRRQLVRHAVRLPARRGEPAAAALRDAAR
jgi:3-methyladenine DNA glycosylase AlkC